MTELTAITQLLHKFRDDRNWRQFHTLKNLIVSLNLEASELLELTQWKSDEQFASLIADAGFRQQLQDECADVFLYLLLISGEGGFDLIEAAQAKLKKNAERYPIEQSYGSAKKYSELKQAGRESTKS